jgi:serine/threonine-protein kinase RsbW
MVIPSEFEAARSVEQLVLDELGQHGYGDSATFAVKLALEESLNNAIKHGNGGDASKTIEVSYDVDPHRVKITVTDEGGGFDPGCVPDPTVDENLEKPSGRGIMLMRFYMDEVSYNSSGSQVRMVKRKS